MIYDIKLVIFRTGQKYGRICVLTIQTISIMLGIGKVYKLKSASQSQVECKSKTGQSMSNIEMNKSRHNGLDLQWTFMMNRENVRKFGLNKTLNLVNKNPMNFNEINDEQFPL